MEAGLLLDSLVSAELRKGLAVQAEQQYWAELEALPLSAAQREELVRLHLQLLDTVWEEYRTLDGLSQPEMGLDELLYGLRVVRELGDRRQILIEKVNVLCGAVDDTESTPPCFLL